MEERKICDFRMLKAVGGTTQSSFRVQLTVSPLSADAKEGRIVVPEVWSVPKLNVAVPRVNNRMIHSWKHLQGLDLRQYSGVQVELLLGANILEAVVQREARVGGPGQLVAVRTDFGWTLTGSISTLMPCTTRKVMFVRRPPSEDERLSETAQERRTEEDTAVNTDKQTAPNTTERTAADVTERTQEAGASLEGAHAFMVKPKLLNDKQRLVEGRRAEPMAEFKGRHRKRTAAATETAANHIIRSGVLLYPVLTAVVILVWGQRLRYPELFSSTAVLLLAMLTLLVACFASATFLQLKLLPEQRRKDRFEQRQGYRGVVTASRPTSGILITFPNLSWRSEGGSRGVSPSRHRGLSSSHVSRHRARRQGLSLPRMRPVGFGFSRQRGVKVFGTSVGYQRPRQRGADTRQRLLPSLTMSQSYSRPSLSVMSTISATWLAAVA